MSGLEILVDLIVDAAPWQLIFFSASAIVALFGIAWRLKKIFWGKLSLQQLGDEERGDWGESEASSSENRRPTATETKVTSDGTNRQI